MSIEYRCPTCQRLLRAGGGTEGRRALCPGCGTFSIVPTPGGASPAAPPPPSGTESPVDASYVDADSPYQAPTQYGQPPPVYYPPPAPSDSRAVVSLVLGLVSVPMMLCCCGPMGASLAVVGLILGLVSMSGPNQGMAIGGVICNGLVLVLTVLIVLLYIVLFVVGQQAGGFGRP